MDFLSILMTLSTFILNVSAADSYNYESPLIVSKFETIPKYPLLETRPNCTNFNYLSFNVDVNIKLSQLEGLLDELFLVIFQYLDYSAALKLSEVSKTKHRRVIWGLCKIYDLSPIRKFEITFNRNELFILNLPFHVLFNHSYPGLSSIHLGSIDYLTLILISLLISSENSSESSCYYFKVLKKFFMNIEFIKKIINAYPNNIFPDIFKCPGYLKTYLYNILNYGTIPYSLQILALIEQKPDLIKNSNYKQSSLVLSNLGVCMAKEDKRFLYNYLSTFNPEAMVNARFGCYHILHELIIRNGTYCSEIFKRNELVSIRNDVQTGLPFYSSALFYALKYQNVSMILGLLQDFPNRTFEEVSVDKLDYLRNVSDFDELFKNLGNCVLKIRNFLS